MTIEYKINLADGTVIITQTTEPGMSPQFIAPRVRGDVLASHELASSFPNKKGGVANPNTRSGTGAAVELDVANPSTRSGFGPPSNSSFEMEHQEEGNWCWAAVSASVDRYFDPGKARSQCVIASKVLEGAEDCCHNKAKFDEGAALEPALDAVNRRRGSPSGSISFEELKAELDAELPVCLRIAWTAGGAHFVSVYGYREWASGARTIEVADPWYESSTQDFDLFPAYYRGGGQWTDTYFTKK